MRKQPPAKRRRKHKLGKQRKSIFQISCKCETKIGKLLMRVFSLLSLPQNSISIFSPGAHTHARISLRKNSKCFCFFFGFATHKWVRLSSPTKKRLQKTQRPHLNLFAQIYFPIA